MCVEDWVSHSFDCSWNFFWLGHLFQPGCDRFSVSLYFILSSVAVISYKPVLFLMSNSQEVYPEGRRGGVEQGGAEGGKAVMKIYNM